MPHLHIYAFIQSVYVVAAQKKKNHADSGKAMFTTNFGMGNISVTLYIDMVVGTTMV